MKTRIIQNREWHENMVKLKQLAFERAMDRWDIDAANIACAQKKWHELRLEQLVYERVIQEHLTPTTDQAPLSSDAAAGKMER